MTNFFALLELPESLSLDPEAVETSWREKSRTLDPVGDDRAADLHEARATLGDPVRRLAHWLALRAPDAPPDRGIDPALMDLFSAISPVLETTDQVLARLRRASTALAKAVLTREAVAAQLEIQELLQRIRPLRTVLLERFDAIEEAGKAGDHQPAVRALGQLKFLQRWEEQCHERLLALIAT